MQNIQSGAQAADPAALAALAFFGELPPAPRPPRPFVLPVQPDGIPAELKQHPRWCGWVYEWRQPDPQKKGAWSKVPKVVQGGTVRWNAQSNKPGSWAQFEDALHAYRHRGEPGSSDYLDGIGFMLGDDFHGIDLDDCIDFFGQPNARALEVLERVDGYAEISPSGTGLKIITRTDLQRSHKKDGVELYTGGRWFATVGQQINGHALLADTPQPLGWLVEREFSGAEAGGTRALSTVGRMQVETATLDAAQQVALLSTYRAPLDGWDAERVRNELLVHLSPDVHNDQWVLVGQCLHHQGLVDGELGGQAWLDLWDEWSQGAPARYVEGECAKRWDSFGRPGRVPATLDKLIEMTRPQREAAAADRRVEARKKVVQVRKAVGAASLLKDVEAGDKALVEVAEQVRADADLQWLFSVGDLNAEGMLVEFARAVKKVKGLGRIPKAEARGWLVEGAAVAIGGMRTEPSDDGPRPAGELVAACREWVLDAATDKYVHLESGAKRSPMAFENQFRRAMPLNAQGGRDSAVEWVRTWGEMTTVEAMTYMPGADPLFQYQGLLFGNSYRASSVPAERAPTSAEEWDAIRAVQEHFEFMIPDARERGLLLSWIAWNVRSPGDKILWYPFIHSTQGAGKSTLINLLCAVMGDANVGKTGNKALHSEFDGWKTGVAVRVLEEVKQAEGGRMAGRSLVETLKEPVTDRHVTVVRKGKDEVQVPNVTNYMAFSNHLDALTLETDQKDRRMFALSSPVTDAQVQERVDNGGFARVERAIAEHGAALRWWLLGGDFMQPGFVLVEEFKPKGHAPWTAAKDVIVAMSGRGEWEELIEEAINGGGHGIGEAVLSVGCLRTRIAELVKQYGGKGVPSAKALSQVLRRIGWTPYEPIAMPGGDNVIKFGGKAHRVWVNTEINPDSMAEAPTLLAKTSTSSQPVL